ncbi:two-component system, OmpR family, sensor kinase [Microlunatus sagamiharensis]|uniref:histidine kinase n=1 Tax=Microlunatus sagamiharensis TaxID=546874 RepID=A0A1H2N1N1_9ACTN|nr:HAMP domain-containing sensor histidine kinase [Microlunatus sagamiharensis]SDU99282.1 two-component system, OmpR family, sensor kinase [Microlunatus sagamiharensis]
MAAAPTEPGWPAPVGAPAQAPLDAFGHGTLGRQLVVRVTVLVALVAILLSTATALAARTLLLGSIDSQLDGVSARAVRGDPGGQRGPRDQLIIPGQPPGSLAAVVADDGSGGPGQIIASDGQLLALPDSVIQTMGGIPAQGKQTVILPGLGRYRLLAGDAKLINRSTGVVTPAHAYWGLPLEAVDHQLAQLIGLEALLTGFAIAGAVVASRTVVRRSLRPLNRVAATAQQVSQLPLDRGEVALAVRVPPADADPTSEVGRVGQAFNHMLNNVEDALAARQASETKVRQFVADASHELRNPLAAIRGYAELTRRERDSMSENAAFAMSRVEAEAERMSYLVEDLLLLARLDSGPDVDVKPVDLSEVVINALSDARAAGPDHVWQLDLPDEPVVALGDRYRLHQVVANLLANARTHTPAGTQVRASVAVRGSDALITVTDSGPGIPEDIRSRVFERFTRAEVSRVRTPGAAAGRSTGLGLAIVAAVVEAHHGTVGVQSQPGRTEFTVTLPLAPVTTSDAARPTAGVA